MEYAKDIVLNLKSGQEVNKRDWRRTRNRRRNTQKVGIFSKTLGKLLRHKIITTVMVVTIGFMAIDIYLVTSFVNVLGKIWKIVQRKNYIRSKKERQGHYYWICQTKDKENRVFVLKIK